ncbi:MAG TPA: glycosyltransferase [Roseiflexaceae bacterium]|jgi:UDP:flavonoid glycosyltransferase YjiC (YdhE family)|nr:glycosyltransferase [Roseiflexaceae bacterium]
MRILFTFVGGSGHFEPLVPIARAAEAAGHTVVFAGQPVMIPAIEAAGFTALATAGATLRGTPERLPLLKVDLEREYRDLREGFARRLARTRAEAILALCAAWNPDLLVCDEIDFGAMIAAERRGVPYASVLVIAAGSFVRKDVVGEPLQQVRAAYGLPPDPDLEMLSRYLVLSPFPPSYRDPAFPLPPTAHSIRPLALDNARAAEAPPWFAGLPDMPLVYFTLGTVFNVESGDLFERMLAGLRDLPVQVIATVGRELDPAEFGPQPDTIRIERYVPQAAILPHCAAVVSHGGSGSVIGALAHGLPSVLVPMGADQPLNALRCADLGVAQVLDAVAATPDSVRAAVTTVLEEPSYRRAAERMRDEIAALPGAAHALMLLERLAAERRPILAA